MHFTLTGCLVRGGNSHRRPSADQVDLPPSMPPSMQASLQVASSSRLPPRRPPSSFILLMFNQSCSNGHKCSLRCVYVEHFENSKGTQHTSELNCERVNEHQFYVLSLQQYFIHLVLLIRFPHKVAMQRLAMQERLKVNLHATSPPVEAAFIPNGFG